LLGFSNVNINEDSSAKGEARVEAEERGLEGRETRESIEQSDTHVARALQELPAETITALLNDPSSRDIVCMPSSGNLESILAQNRSSELGNALERFLSTKRQDRGDPFERFRDFIEEQSNEAKRAFLTSILRIEPRAALPVLAALRRKIDEIEQNEKDSVSDEYVPDEHAGAPPDRLEQAKRARREGRQSNLLNHLRIPGLQHAYNSARENLLGEQFLNRTRDQVQADKERFEQLSERERSGQRLADEERQFLNAHRSREEREHSLQENVDQEIRQHLATYRKNLESVRGALLASIKVKISAKAYELDQRLDHAIRRFEETNAPNARVRNRHDMLRDALYPLQAYAEEGECRRITDIPSAENALVELGRIEAEVMDFERDPAATARGDEQQELETGKQAEDLLRGRENPIFDLSTHGPDNKPLLPRCLQEVVDAQQNGDQIDGLTKRRVEMTRRCASFPDRIQSLLGAERLHANTEQKRKEMEKWTAERLDNVRQEIQKRGRELTQEIASLLDEHPILDQFLPLRANLVTTPLAHFERLSFRVVPRNEEKEKQDLAEAQVILEELKKFHTIARAKVVECSPTEFTQHGGQQKWKGFYYPKDGKIYINDGHQAFQQHSKLREETIHHEQGHALLWAFEKTLGQGLLFQLSDHIESKLTEEQRKALDEFTKHNDCGQQEGENSYEQKFNRIDEYLNRIGTLEWLKRWAESERDEDKKKIIELLIPDDLRTLGGDVRFKKHEKLPEAPSAVAAETETEAEHEALRRAEAEARKEIEAKKKGLELEVHNLQERFAQIERSIYLLQTWVKTYAHLPGATEWSAIIAGYGEELGNLKQIWLKINSRGIVKRSRHEEFLERFEDLFQAVLGKNGAIDRMQVFDQDQLDLRGAPQTGRTFALWLLRDIDWMTVWDLWKMIKDFGEDIKRRWKRRQEGVVGSVGKGITHWIPDAVPYLGVLKHESRRREQAAELEEVEQWKKSLKNMDKYAIREFGLNAQIPDQLKAAIEELTDRGDMNWADNRFWLKLSSFSHFTMPIEECKRNENLRERWLHKIIGDIWGDYDLYDTKWKKTNDAAIEGGKEKWRDECDRLSNMANGLPGELARMLMIARQYQRDPTNPVIRGGMRTVSHTKYEKIIFYSIDNGKMSMEQKLFYLIQGIDAGIIMPDRLRSIAGETGKILNRFPVIDYFYQSNNTIPEISALARRLMENPGNPLDPVNFKPGTRTTLWLNIEVAREKKVQERLRKGIDRAANDMDHDDFHIFLPRLDAAQIDQLAGPVGGARQKITRDAWQNGYVGFNAYFQSMAYLAQMDDDKVPDQKFAAEDAADVARAVGAYLKMDGILTQRFVREADLRIRPYLTPSELAFNRPVLGELRLIKYKTPLDSFVMNLMKAYGISEEDILSLTEKRTTKGDTEITRRNMLCDEIAAILQDQIASQGTGEMKRLLMASLTEPERDKQFEQYAGGEILKYKKVKEIFEKLPKEKQRYLAEAAAA
jgi:hypothetical protein